MKGYVREVWPQGHPDLPESGIGVLLVNLGTPAATDYWSVRRYLSEFLSDRRVIELSPWLWQPILQGIILTVRPGKSGRAYDAIWDRETNESPLRRITREQNDALAGRLGEKYPSVQVRWAMRYGVPSLKSEIGSLIESGCRRILLLPLYPQYSAATTATACDEAFRVLMKQRWQASLRVTPPYHDDPAYISALVASLQGMLESLSWEPEVVLASFHGLPRECLEKGDPYHCHCQKTGRLLREALGWREEKLRVTFQSRFGPKAWLQPYSDETVKQLAGEGIKRLAILSPGFAADCLETLEEVAIGLRETFLAAGGEEFCYVPCLNTRDDHMDFLEGLIERELSGWL
ncbi:ferrochelatase [Limibacillus sp. MBR-115]|jgi:ferrochelatase|uniref:ferrochelatase n=1 Tax=Limibacillus sp. MBR-115 TaxID=3156465 RepID=UPI003391E373